MKNKAREGRFIWLMVSGISVHFSSVVSKDRGYGDSFSLYNSQEAGQGVSRKKGQGKKKSL